MPLATPKSAQDVYLRIRLALHPAKWTGAHPLVRANPVLLFVHERRRCAEPIRGAHREPVEEGMSDRAVVLIHRQVRRQPSSEAARRGSAAPGKQCEDPLPGMEGQKDPLDCSAPPANADVKQ